MRSLFPILLHRLPRQIATLGWRKFIDLIADTFQKLGIAGLAFGIYQENDAAIGIGLLNILLSGIITLFINRSKNE